MIKNIDIFSLFFFFISCTTQSHVPQRTKNLDYGSPKVSLELLNDYVFKISSKSVDASYGYSAENPVMVGGGSEGPSTHFI